MTELPIVVKVDNFVDNGRSGGSPSQETWFEICSSIFDLTEAMDTSGEYNVETILDKYSELYKLV